MTWAFATAGRIAFGPGVATQALDLAAGRRVLVVTGANPARADWLVKPLGAHVFSVPREPTLALVEAGVALARALDPDLVIGIGGGAALDTAKAIAALMREPGAVLDHLEVVGRGLPLTATPPPVIAIPTTAGTGAEVTRNAVIGVPGRKVSLRDPRLLPAHALVDPDLTLDLPRQITLACGLDALTQVIEPYLCPQATPLTDALCRDAIPRGLAALPRVLADPGDRAARADMALVSLFGGLALANARLGAVHGLAGVLGGVTTLPHGAICGLLLPRVLAANRAALAPDHSAAARLDEVEGWIGAALGSPPLAALARLAAPLPRLEVADPQAVARAAQASSSMAGNPVALGVETLAALLTP